MNMVLLFSSPMVVFLFVFILLFAVTSVDAVLADDNVTSVDVALADDNVTSVDVALADDNDSKMIPIDLEYVYYKQSDRVALEPYIGNIIINPSKDGGCGPNTMFTIVPSDDGSGVTIETSPANLLTAVNKYSSFGSELVFEWNMDVSSTATSGGVRIGVPSNELKKVLVYEGHNVQVVDGFTNITSLVVEGDGSILRASMTSLSNSTTSLTLRNMGGTMYVETNIPMTGGSMVVGGGKSWVETPSYNGHIGVKDNGSQLTINGDVDASNYHYLDNYELAIKGDVDKSDFSEESVSDGAQLTVTGTITGTINSVDDSIVNAPSCDNVISSDNSTCNAGPQNVDIDFGDLSQNKQIRYGTITCGGEDSSSSPSYLAPSDSAVNSIDVILADATDNIMILSSSSFTHVSLIAIVIAAATTMLI